MLSSMQVNNPRELAALMDGPITLNVGASTALAGTDAATAATLPAATARVYPVTGANTEKGAKIHEADKVTGRMIWIYSTTAGQDAAIYPPAGGTINGAAANAAYWMNGLFVLLCVNASTNTWVACPGDV